MSKLRIAFIGKDGIFSVWPLRSLLSMHDIVGIANSMPRSFGSSRPTSVVQRALGGLVERRDPELSLRHLADERTLPYLDFKKSEQATLKHFLRRLKPDLVCVAAMSGLLDTEALSIPKLGTINIHPSLLPRYRGPLPWFWQYYSMDSESGATTFLVDQGSDTGNILTQGRVAVSLGMTFTQLLTAISKAGQNIILPAVDLLRSGHRGIPQPKSIPHAYARRIKSDEMLIDWKTWTIERCWHVLRGGQRWINPIAQPSGWRRHFGWRVMNIEKTFVTEKPGTLGKDREGAYIAHRDGKIRLETDLDLSLNPLRAIESLKWAWPGRIPARISLPKI